jgi:hypothetical protein
MTQAPVGCRNFLNETSVKVGGTKPFFDIISTKIFELNLTLQCNGAPWLVLAHPLFEVYVPVQGEAVKVNVFRAVI